MLNPEFLMRPFFLKRNVCVISTLLCIITFSNCASTRKITRNSSFDYQNIYKKQYEEGNGGLIRLTLNKGETYSGSITPDGKYLIYTSNQKGNFDIYIRPLSGITNIPILRSATNETDPVVSPNGKLIAFIDDELDPGGDLTILKFDPARIFKEYQAAGQPAVDALYLNQKVYLTNDPHNISRFRDSNPAWSPDSKWLAYSTDKPLSNGSGESFGSIQNVWMLSVKNPGKAIPVTTDGGLMPCFSPDGKKILYANDSDKKGTFHIFEIDITSGKKNQLTYENTIDIYPNYSNDGKKIVFTRISTDTNDDGTVDFKDNGQVMIQPLAQNDARNSSAIEMTFKNQNVFNTKVTQFLNGSILFAIKEGDNINLALIPEEGIFPRKNSATDQLQYAKDMPEKSGLKSNREMAMRLLDFRNQTDPINKFVANLKDFVLLDNEGSGNTSAKERILQTIRQKISDNVPFEKILLDVYYKRNPGELPDNYSFQFSGGSLKNYLNEIFKNPARASQSRLNGEEKNISSLDTLPLYDQTTLGYLFETYGNILKKQGALSLSREVFQSILYNFPGYYNSALIVLEQGKVSNQESEIPEEYLYLLEPKKNPLTVHNYVPSENISNSDSSPEPKSRSLDIKINPEITAKAENEIFVFFKKVYKNNDEQIIQSMEEKYSESSFPFLANLRLLAKAEYLNDTQKYSLSSGVMQKINANSLQDEWMFRLFTNEGKSFENTSQLDKAYASYLQALLRYEKKFNIDDIDNLVYKVFSYYRKSANLYRKSGKVAEAWNAFLPLIQLILNLEPKGIAPHVVESTSLHTFIDLDEMLLKFNDNQTIHAVLDFYKTNIEFARKNTINSFIFGRAYLNTMYGIKLHRNFEANRELNKENKETVLTYFFEAEEDFQWSIYADATFADAYIMLGWMYQFIDEKRDTDVYTSKIGNEMKKDKNIFSSLYKKYFPDYLYEKNIELYQKSLTYLPLDSNPEVIQSIRLNLANNYFLLNNYAKAEENYSNITLTGKNKYLFNSKVQEAQFYFHFGKAGFFLGHYNDALVRLDKSLQYYNARSPKKLPEKTIVYFQKSAILKYLAMSASNAGKYDKAVEYYREVINASKGTSINDNLSMIYLEISRNLLEQMNLTHNLHRSSEALSTLDLAEADIRKFPVIKSPRYPTKFKIFGLDLFNFNMPWFSEPDDVFKGGDNHLAYKMPTLNQLEYLHSIRADIYKIIGGYSKSAFALAQLVEEAGRDDTKHGRQTLLSALMRSGELQFIAGDMKGARDKYELALKKAIDADNMKIYYLAAKNLMAIACREIDLGKSSLEKHKLAAQHLKELDSFKNQYVKLETDKAEEELKDKNPHIKLTISEKAKIEKDAISKISRILIYRGIFEAYSLMYGDNPSAKQKATDLAAYYQNAEKNYQSNKNVLYSLDGFAKIQGEDIKLYDQKKDRRLSMILDLDKGLVYESMGELDKAMDIYKETYDKAYEFKANEFLIVSGFRYYSLAHMAGKNDAYKVLQKIDSTFKLYPYLAKKRQEIFREISNAMIQENLKNKQYMNTIYLANFNRVIKLKKILESMLSSLDENLANELNDYKELEKVEEILAADIENLKIQRESTDSLDSIMEQLLKEKVKIKNAILKNPKLSGYAYALFPDLLSVNDIINIKASYLYIIENESGTNFIYKYPDQNNFETRTFALTSKSVEEFLTHEDSSPEKPSIQNMPVEFKNFISWIKNKNISIIYPDVNYMSFPFSKYTQNNAPRDFTVQSTLLFSKNTNITATRFIQNGKFGIPVENPLNMPDVTSISSNKNPDNWYNGIDFEITQKDFNGNSPVFREIIERRSPSALSIFSYSIEDKSQLVLYTSAVNILLAASNSTTAIHLTGARSAMGNTVAKIIEGNIKNKDNIIYSGNTDISGSLINRSSPDSARILSRYQKVELETCDLFTLKQSRDFQYDSALNNIEKCNDIYNNMETKLMQGKNSKDITTAKVPPDFHRFLSKVNILLDSGTDSNLLQVPKEFQLFKDKTSLDDGSLPLAFNQQALKYITLLLGADQEEMAFNVFKILPAEFHYTKANYFSILESYYLGKLFSGNLTAFLNDPPETLKNIPEKNSLTDEKLPENLSERIRYFMKGTLQKDKWIQAMTISGEYKNAIAYLQNGISTLSLWQKIDYLISTNKRENFPFNDPALLSLKKLMSFESTPAEYDKIIESFAGDQALKNFAGIIRNIKSSQITEKDIADSFLKNISENDRDGFYKKQTLINYLVQFIDSEKNSELANKNLLTVISGCSFGKSIKNRQQKLYADISGSVNALGSTTEKLNDLIKNGNNGVSFANSAFIGQLIAISVNLNPFEGLKMASQNTSFLGVGQQETFSRLENLLKQDNGIKDITYADFSFMEKYYIMAHENEKALSTYFSFDRNQKPEKFAFEKNLSGIFMINSDEYYSWTWSQNKATINRISEAEISKTLASFADNINYIPSKDKRLRDLILSRESGLKYFSATASPEQTLQDVTSKISWDYDSANTPGYSIMKIWLPDPDKNTNSESNATDIGYYGKKSGSSRINFQDDPVNITQIEALMNIHKSGYHILFTNQSSYNMYLTLMKEFINQSRDEIQKPMELFGKVLKNLGKLYPNNENLNNIIMVEN